MKSKTIYRLGINYVDSKGVIKESIKKIEVIDDNGKTYYEKVGNKPISKSQIDKIKSVFERKHDNIKLYSYCYSESVPDVRKALRDEFSKRFKEKRAVVHRLNKALSNFYRSI